MAEWVACSCICTIRTWHFELWPEAGNIAKPVSAHRTMTSDSTNDKLLLIALREIMPISLSLLATQPSVTWITALWFDGPRPKMVPCFEARKICGRVRSRLEQFQSGCICSADLHLDYSAVSVAEGS